MSVEVIVECARHDGNVRFGCGVEPDEQDTALLRPSVPHGSSLRNPCWELDGGRQRFVVQGHIAHLLRSQPGGYWAHEVGIG